MEAVECRGNSKSMVSIGTTYLVKVNFFLLNGLSFVEMDIGR